MTRYCIDFDGTITKKVVDYLSVNTEVNASVVNRINELYNKGHTITIFTSRGMKSIGNKLGAQARYEPMVRNILEKNNVKYHQLEFGKVSADVYIDDLGMSIDKFLVSKNILFGKFGREIEFNPSKWSSSGGHFESVAMIEILSKENNVYMFGDYSGQLPDGVKPYDGTQTIDIVYVDNGVGPWSDIADTVDVKVLNTTNSMVEIINTLNKPMYYSYTDPRLELNEKAKEHILVPVTVINQNEFENRGHQEKLALLNYPEVTANKKENLLVVIGRDNGRGMMYDDFLTVARKYFDVEVYGNFKLVQNADLFRGQLKASQVSKVYERAKFAMMISIGQSWLTQKLFEVAHHKVIPLMYCKYDTNRLETRHLKTFKFKDNIDLKNMLQQYKENDIKYEADMFYLTQELLKPKYYSKDWWAELYRGLLK